jgi:hypothetical protein
MIRIVKQHSDQVSPFAGSSIFSAAPLCRLERIVRTLEKISAKKIESVGNIEPADSGLHVACS